MSAKSASIFRWTASYTLPACRRILGGSYLGTATSVAHGIIGVRTGHRQTPPLASHLWRERVPRYHHDGQITSNRMNSISHYSRRFPNTGAGDQWASVGVLRQRCPTQKPRPVLEAIQRYYEHDNANVHRGIHELSNHATAAYEGARHRVPSLSTRPRRGHHFPRGTTEALNLVAATWGAGNCAKAM